MLRSHLAFKNVKALSLKKAARVINPMSILSSKNGEYCISF
jgi:hypothetical protein